MGPTKWRPFAIGEEDKNPAAAAYFELSGRLDKLEKRMIRNDVVPAPTPPNSDSELPVTEQAITDIIAEFKRTTQLKGPFRSEWEGESVLRGELKELSEEVWGHQPDRQARMRAEAIQVAAMALRFVVDVCGEVP